jgi:hypothetical protein
MSTELDLLPLAPIAVFLLAAMFATLAAVKRRTLLDYLRRLRSA